MYVAWFCHTQRSSAAFKHKCCRFFLQRFRIDWYHVDNFLADCLFLHACTCYIPDSTINMVNVLTGRFCGWSQRTRKTIKADSPIVDECLCNSFEYVYMYTFMCICHVMWCAVMWCNVCMHACMYICKYVDTYIYIYIYINTYIYIHMFYLGKNNTQTNKM